MRYRVDFGWDSQQEIYACFEAETIADAERVAMHLLDRIRITRVVRVHPLDEGLAKSTNLPRAVITDIEEDVDHSRWACPTQPVETTTTIDVAAVSPDQSSATISISD
jgi:hypothetical protein